MDQKTSENLSQIGEVVGGNSKNLVNGVVSETVIVKNCEEKICFNGENADSSLQNGGFGRGIGQVLSQNDSESSGNSSSLVDENVLKNEERDLGLQNNVVASSERLVEESINEEAHEIRGVAEPLGQVDHGRSGSFVCETIIVINTQEAACVNGSNEEFKAKENGLGSSKVSAERPKTKVTEAENSCVVDIKGNDNDRKRFKESWDGETVCRICHLNSEPSCESTDSTSTTEPVIDLIQLGCGCKDELGIAHSHCAEAWFKLRGNRICEICGQTAKNVSGVRDNRFIEDWHGQGSTSDGVTSFSDRRVGCWRGQPFCNFLMACLVMAFVLPWFFRVNMF